MFPLSVESHPAYAEESGRLDETLADARLQLIKLRAVPPLNIPELIDESMEALLHAELAMERMRLEQIRRLDLAIREPYFGRIDFAEGEQPVERFYIGKVGLWKGGAQEPLVLDWRTPMASLFYTSATGSADEVAYEAPDGLHRGTLWLKRHLGVRQGILQRIVDARVKGAPAEAEPLIDEFLSYRLQESRDSRLRDIVSTIQAEQNAIIRAPMDRPLIIQGVAGSGKTTVALHRLAYLLYTHRETVAAGRIIIFAPSRMFLDYIADVLPELGVDGVVQTTFADWALAELDDPAVQVADTADRLEHLFAPGQDPGAGADGPGRFKGSLLFREVLDLALARYEATFVPEQDLALWPGATLPARTVKQWFHEAYKSYPLMARKERCIARARKWADDHLMAFAGTMHEQERRKLVRNAVNKWVKLWPDHTPLQLYQQILGARPPKKVSPADVGSADIPGRVIRESLAHFRRDEVAPEDLAPLVYLKARLRGYSDDRQLDHVVIDEAQDFSPFQVDLLKRLTRGSSFTILGDLSQGIHAHQGIHRWEELMEAFDPDPVAYYTLEQSYRSTYEVMTFANQVLARLGPPVALARPVFRSGAPVRVEAVAREGLVARIAARVRELRAHKMASVAVIGRTEAECRTLHEALAALELEPELITPRQSSYRGGLSVIPAYLVKGLEFDAVIVADACGRSYGLTQRDAKLLYVACTRALHELTLFHTGDPSPLLPRAGDPQHQT